MLRGCLSLDFPWSWDTVPATQFTSHSHLAWKLLKGKGESRATPKTSVEMEHSLCNPTCDVIKSARERFRQSPHPALWTLSCDFDQGVLRLQGQLSSFYHKQLAQEAVAHLAGVTKIVNEVIVAAW